MKTELFNVFNEKQIALLKAAVKCAWGDSDIMFEGCDKCDYAWGFYTNDIHCVSEFNGKTVSGLCSSISKKVKKLQLNFIKFEPDWWGDGSGDMVFFNMEKLECTIDELEKWANS